MDLEDAETFYHDEIAQQMRADGLDPAVETPTYAWLNSAYPGFVKHLSRHLDLSPGEFYDGIGVPTDPDEVADSGPFAFLDDAATRTALNEYLKELEDRQGRAAATIATRRSALRLYTRTYQDVHGVGDLLTPLYDEARRGEELDRVADTFDVLRRREDTLRTHASKRKYVQEVGQFYAHQVMFDDALYNPTDRLERRFGWDSTTTWDNEGVTADQIRRLYETASTSAERLLVVAVCVWGLRPSEVAALHIDQLVLDPPEDGADVGPYIEFGEERKNGPGTVAILAGIGDLTAHIDAVSDDIGDEWTGYLFPSSQSAAGHRSTSTIRRRFKALSKRAEIAADGAVPTPKMGRRYWYTTYGEAVRRVADRFADVAEEQGSSSAEVVLDNYLSESELRRHRREEMRADLAGLLTGR